MSNKDNTTLIREGNTEVFVQSVKKTNRGPGTRSNNTFYNPAMESSRDLSIAITQWFMDKNKRA
ncbi:MAG: hypothetical protein QXS02_05760 [Candidatus Thermoplasmatota archaeon]